MTQENVNQNNTELKAWVVFRDKTELGILKPLKRGFRHCFVILNDGKRWISVDPLSNHMDVLVHDLDPDFDLPGWMAERDCTVLAAPIARDKMCMAPILPFSCVEAVKRVLGIHAWHILTPYQLYSYLQRRQFVFAAPSTTQKLKEIFYGWRYIRSIKNSVRQDSANAYQHGAYS